MFQRMTVLSVFFLVALSVGVQAQEVSRNKAAVGKKSADAGKLRTLAPPERQALLAVRELAWRAFFAGDVATLKKILPEEFIAMNEEGGEWQNRAAVQENARQFVAGGGKLIRLEFPKTEIQAYGASAIIYTTYLYEIEMNGKRSLSQGRATEMFVFRDKQWLHNGWHLEVGK